MNTILTDDEVMDAFCKHPHAGQFVAAFQQGARWAEAAVLAKLREQEPLSDDARELIGAMVSELRQHRWCGDCYPENGWPEVNKVLADYAKFKRQRSAAPLPAVVQVPQEFTATADNDFAYGYQDGWNACRKAMLAAAPEAPAQNGHLADDERVAALCTLSYAAGMKAGWNYCASEDNEGFERSQKSVGEAIRILKAHRAAAEAPAQAAPSADEVERGDVVAFEFYNRATGHAIVDYSVNTHVGNLSADKGYEARPLVYADKREEVTDGSKPIPLWQAREALDELEAAARGDEPFNHFAAGLVRSALEQAAAPEAPAQSDPLEKLTRIQEELSLYDDKPAQGECDAKPGPMSIARMACALDGETRYAYQEIQNLVKTINYMVGIAERGRGVRCPPQEAPERFLLNYVKELEAAAPAQPSVPAPWREAVKVMRTTLEDWLGDYGDCAEGGESDELVKFTRAAIALADSLEGGE